jgi:hypothetical protein
MRRKPKFLLAIAIAIITFESLKALVPKEFQDRNCHNREHFNDNYHDHQSKTNVQNLH